MLGYPVADWYQDESLWMRICYPDDIERVRAVKAAATPQNDRYEIVYRLRTAQGEWLWIMDRVQVEFVDGVPVRCRGISYDVSERRRIEDALSLVVDVAVEAGELSSLDDIFVHCLNRIGSSGCWILGQVWVPSSMPGHNGLNGMDGPLVCNPNAVFYGRSLDLESIRQESLETTFGLGQGLPGHAAFVGSSIFLDAIDEEPRLSLKDSGIISSGFAFPVRRGNEVMAVFEFFGDVRQRPDKYFLNAIEEIGAHLAVLIDKRQTQELLVRQIAQEQVVIDSTPAFVFFKDRRNRVIRVNQAVIDALGISNEKLVGMDLADIFPMQAEEYYRDDLEVMSTGQPKLGIIEQVTWTGRQEDLQWVSTDKVPYRDHNGQIIGIIAFAVDITKLKATEDQLLASQQDLELKVEERTKELEEANIFFNLSRDLLCIADSTGHFKRINKAWSEKLGYAQEELLSRPFFELVHPEDLNASMGAQQYVLDGNALFEFQNRYICKDGSIIWLQWSAVRNPDSGMIFGVAYDITDRKKAEDELLDISHALKNAVEGIAKVDVDGRYLSVNQSYANLLGFEQEQMVGMSFRDAIYGADLAKFDQCFSDMLEANKGETELLGRRSDGRIFHEAITLVRVNDKRGKYTGFYIFNKDISVRKEIEVSLQQSEARFNQLSAHVPGGIYQYVHAADGRDYFPYMSQSCKSILEVDPVDIMRDPMLAYENVYQEDLPGLLEANRQANINLATFSHEWRIHLPSGGMKWVRATSSPERLDNGDILFNGLLTDITQERLSEEKIKQLNVDLSERVQNLASVNSELETLTRKLEVAYDAALEASKLKSEFVANISHEIRTPISAVIGMSELLLDSPLSDEQKQLTNMVKDSAKSLLTIINDILDFSKIEAGHIELDIIEFNLLELMEDCALLLAPAARKKGLNLYTWIDPRLPLFLRGDPVRIRQILLNLAGNAVKFTRKGEVLIRADYINQDNAGDKCNLRITVEDTGVGMSDAARSRLFKPFVQADGSTTRKFGGTGLGLSISRLLVDIMGGEIDFASQLSVGSSFWFKLALDRASDHITVGQKVFASKSIARAGGGDGDPRPLLIVAGSNRLCSLLSGYLGYLGIPCVIKNSLAEFRRAMTAPDEGPSKYRACIYDFSAAIKRHNISVTTSSSPAKNTISGSFLIRPNPIEIEGLIKMSDYLEEAGAKIPLLVLGLGDLSSDARLNRFQDVPRLLKPFRLSDLVVGIKKILKSSVTNSGQDSRDRACNLDDYDDSGSHEQLKQKVQFVVKGRGVPVQGSQQSALRVLVAEDNPVMRELALRQLEKLGLEADGVANGNLAARAAASGRYAVILMDCQMPEMDGYEATIKIRKEEAMHGGHIPIIAMTASAMSGDREKCIATGMDDYLSKPVSREQLMHVLAQWLPSDLYSLKSNIISREQKDQAPGSDLQQANAPDNVKLADPDPQILENPPIDLDSLVNLYGEDGLESLLDSFRRECEELMAGIKSSLDANQYLELVRLAHQLKGLAVVMTAQTLGDKALALESQGRKGEGADQPLSELCQSVEAELAATLAYLDR
ncbi:MAG: PAS domain S-box protein [Candidatus Obscuribacterales bacterium]|nr:PAS domain S-box protein [Candidatus Obscuribacterales bacterium]